MYPVLEVTTVTCQALLLQMKTRSVIRDITALLVSSHVTCAVDATCTTNSGTTIPNNVEQASFYVNIRASGSP